MLGYIKPEVSAALWERVCLRKKSESKESALCRRRWEAGKLGLVSACKPGTLGFSGSACVLPHFFKIEYVCLAFVNYLGSEWVRFAVLIWKLLLGTFGSFISYIWNIFLKVFPKFLLNQNPTSCFPMAALVLALLLLFPPLRYLHTTFQNVVKLFLGGLLYKSN